MKRLLVKYAWFISAMLVFVGYLMLFRTAEVRGSSMEPTYSSRDLLLLWRTEEVDRGSIVAIYNEQMNEVLCKRVIGTAGDEIVVNRGGLSVNGEVVREPYTSTEDWYNSTREVSLTVPVGEIFVMGDNRIASNDSRALGCMPNSDIIGVVIINATKTLGVRRDTLIRAVTILLVLSFGYDWVKRLRGKKDEIGGK